MERRSARLWRIKGRCMDTIFVERLWTSLRYEDIDLRA
jgi:hypothetical protein